MLDISWLLLLVLCWACAKVVSAVLKRLWTKIERRVGRGRVNCLRDIRLAGDGYYMTYLSLIVVDWLLLVVPIVCLLIKAALCCVA